MTRVRFRRSGAIPVAALVAFFGAVPLATALWYLTPVLLVPLAVTVWGWRSGTEAGPDGLVLRALLGARRLRWDQVTAFVPRGRRVYAHLAGDREIMLPAVVPGNLQRLVEVAEATPGTEPERAKPDGEAERAKPDGEAERAKPEGETERAKPEGETERAKPDGAR